MCVSKVHQFILSFTFSIWFLAQLLTINWSDGENGARSAEFFGVLESIKQLREQYEYRAKLLESNSIGLSSEINLYVQCSFKI